MPPPTTSALSRFRTVPIIGSSCGHERNLKKTIVGGWFGSACLQCARSRALHASAGRRTLYGAQRDAHGGGPDSKIHRRDWLSRGGNGPYHAAADRAAAEEVWAEAGKLPHRDAADHGELEAMAGAGGATEDSLRIRGRHAATDHGRPHQARGRVHCNGLPPPGGARRAPLL